MAGKGQRREAVRLDNDSEFFVQFADQAFLRRFPRIDLAARKLPESGERLAFRALSQQHPAIGIDQRTGRHKDDRMRRSVSPAPACKHSDRLH